MKNLFYSTLFLLLSISTYSQNLYFPPISGNAWDTISPASLNWCQGKIDSLFHYLEVNKTKSFILLKDGKIVLEKYFGTHTQNDPWYWASAGKTITAFMVGIAQQEGLLSITDKTSDYLGVGWTNCTQEQEDVITIAHQLTMTTGLDDGVVDPYCTLPECLLYKAEAGNRWAYHNAPYTLLDGVIEQATGQTLNVYTTLQLKNPTGMTGGFFSLGYNNVFFSNARSMARFGLLILNQGNWNGNQILTDVDYFYQMTHTSQTLNQGYGYLWWLNGTTTFMVPQSQIVFPGSLSPKAPPDMFAAMGKDGQFLNIVPSKNMVWLRMGENPDGLPVPFLMNNEIWGYINELECTSSAVIDYPANKNVVIMPNPASDYLEIISDFDIQYVELYTITGQFVKTITLEQSRQKIPVWGLQQGTYFVRIYKANGAVSMQSFVKM